MINAVDESSPQTLQAVKLLAQYKGRKASKVRRRAGSASHVYQLVLLSTLCCVQDSILATLESWLQDSSISRNPAIMLVAGTILACEGDIAAALKACHGSSSLET